MRKIYALYKGEELLADGTIEEIAKKLKVKKRTIQFYKTDSYLKRRSSDNWKKLFFLGEE